MKRFPLWLTLLFLGTPVYAQTPIDPLKLPDAEAGSYVYTLGIGYTPDGQEDIFADPFGNPVRFTRFNQGLDVTFSGSYSFNEHFSISGNVSPTLSIRQETQELENDSITETDTETNIGGGLAVEYRFAPQQPLDPRVSVGVNYPWSLNFQTSASLLKDPVILLTSVGYNHSLETSEDSITVGLGAGFVANENISFSGTASYSIPLGEVNVPVTSLGFRTGYNLDPEGKRELGLRTTISVRGRETIVGFGLEYGGRGRFGGVFNELNLDDNERNVEPAEPPKTNQPTENTPAPVPDNPNQSSESPSESRTSVQTRQTANVSTTNDTEPVTAAIEELYRRLEEKDAQIEMLQQQIRELEGRLETLSQ